MRRYYEQINAAEFALQLLVNPKCKPTGDSDGYIHIEDPDGGGEVQVRFESNEKFVTLTGWYAYRENELKTVMMKPFDPLMLPALHRMLRDKSMELKDVLRRLLETYLEKRAITGWIIRSDGSGKDDLIGDI